MASAVSGRKAVTASNPSVKNGSPATTSPPKVPISTNAAMTTVSRNIRDTSTTSRMYSPRATQKKLGHTLWRRTVCQKPSVQRPTCFQ